MSRSPEAFHELLRRRAGDGAQPDAVGVPSVDPGGRGRRAERAELALRYVIFGGEALELRACGRGSSATATPAAAGQHVRHHRDHRARDLPPDRRTIVDAAPGSVIGEPIPDLSVYVLDADRQPVPIGVPGEMYVGGAGVARGYLNRPELTARALRRRSVRRQAGARLYRTGDLARRLPDGDLEYLGRIDHQVKIRGFRIELGEIEAVHRPASAGARGGGHGARGFARRQATGRVCGRRGRSARDRRGAAANCSRASCPNTWSRLHFVVLDALPLTANGKVDRRALPAPEIGRGELTQAVRCARARRPRRRWRGIWSAVLGVEQVGIDDNFFELGGDSILSIQVDRQVLGRPAWRSRRAISSSAHDRSARASVGPASRSRQPTTQSPPGAVPLTPIQHWFFEQEIAASDHWNQSLVFEVPPDIDVDVLEEALHRVVLHHDALRLRFRRSADGWQQEYGRLRRRPRLCASICPPWGNTIAGLRSPLARPSSRSG